MDKKIKLEVGCGDKEPKEGFIGVDIRKFDHVKYVCNSWELSHHLNPKTVNEIYSRHCFEHLTFYQADLTLKDWNRILVNDGRLNIVIPDLEYHCNQLLDKKNLLNSSEINPVWHNAQHALSSIFGWQNQAEDGKTWDIHKSGYTYELLKLKLESFGFGGIKRLKDNPWNLNVEAFKVEDYENISTVNFKKNFEPRDLSQVKVNDDWVKSAKNELKSKKVAIYGAGELTKKILRETSLGDLDIVAIFDVDKNKENTVVNDIRVVHSSRIEEFEFEKIIISILNPWSVKDLIEEKFGVNKAEVIEFDD